MSEYLKLEVEIEFSNENDVLFKNLFDNVLSKIQPEWKYAALKSKIFTEGLTNKLYGFWNDSSTSISQAHNPIILRINGVGTENIISRDKEIQTWTSLYQNNLAVKIYAIFKNGMAFAYCPGETINEQEIREPNFYISIARNLARVHNLSLSEIPKLDSPQWVVNTENFISKIKNFDQFVVEKPDDTCLYNQKYFQDRLSSLKNYQFKSKFNFQFSFCHNDLLGNNILFENFNDPNHPSQIANFIDYEYAGWNFCSFDVGNHFNEFCGTENIDYERDYPDLELRKKWASEYLKGRNLDENQVEISEEEIANFLADTEIMSLASHLMWGIWALFQHENTLLDDFDYKTYADERCGEMEKKAQKLGFEW